MKLVTPLQRRLLRYLARYLFPFIALLVATLLIHSATDGAVPVLVKHFVDKLPTFSKSHAPGLLLLSIEILALFWIRAAAGFGSNYLTAYVTQKIVLDMRAELNDRLQRLPLSFFNRTPTGVMLSRVVNDVNLAVSGALSGLSAIFGSAASLLGLIGVAFWLDWRLALIAFVVFPAAVLPIVQFSKRMRRMTKEGQRQLGGITVVLQETYQGNRVVKAFGMEDYERRRFNSELRRLFHIHLRIARIKAFTSPMIEAMAACAVVGVLWWGTMSVMSGERTAGTFAGFLGAMILVYNPFKSLSKTNNSVQQGLAAAERVFDMMDTPNEVIDDPEGLELSRSDHHIEFQNVSFRYNDGWILRNINLEIGAGQVVALVGMSGGGKSTLADLIPRFYDPQEGRIAIDGIDSRRYRLASLRSRIGLVTQTTFLFNDTVRNNIAYGSLEKDDARTIHAAKLANAHDFIMRLPNGYDTVIGELGVRLSGGERQRLAIARALLKDAPILILDEATSSLDSESERSVQQALEHLMANRTTLVIAHRLSTVRRADRIVVIVDGQIIESGTHEELLALGQEYRKLHDLQFLSPEELVGNGGREAADT